MLSKTTKWCLAISIQLVFYACAAPIRWSAKKRCAIFVKSKIYSVFSLLSFSLMVLYESFLIFRFFQAFYLVHNGAHVRHIIQISYFVCTYGIPIHLQLNTFYRWHDLPALVNSFVGFYYMCGRNFVIPQKKPLKNGCERLFKIFFFLAVLINVQNAALLLRNPDKSFFFSSLLPQPRKLSMIQRIPFLCLHGYIWFVFWSQILFYGHVMYSYTFPGVFILNQMRIRKGKQESQQLTRPSLRRADNFIKMYRALQVQHKFFNFCLQFVFFPGHKFFMSGLAILSTYGALKVNNKRAILMACAAFTSLLYMSVLLRKLGRFFEESVELLYSWGGQTKFIDKFRKSCRPLSVKVGCYYVIKVSTVLSLWGFVINTTITLLLM